MMLRPSFPLAAAALLTLGACCDHPIDEPRATDTGAVDDHAADMPNIPDCAEDWGGVCPDPGSGATPTTLLEESPMITGLAVDGRSIYWSVGPEDVHDEGRVSRMPIEGGETVVLAAGGLPSRLRVAGGTVYWLDSNSIMAMDVDGGPLRRLVDPPDEGGDLIVDFTVDVGSGKVYWTQFDWELEADTIRAAPLAGGVPETLVTLPASSLLGWGFDARQLAVDESGIYWTTPQAVMRADLDGDNVAELHRALCDASLPIGVAVDATHVYWIDHTYHRQAVMKIDKRGGEPVVLSDASMSAQHLALDHGHVYSSGGRDADPEVMILKTPKDGGCPTAVTAGMEESPLIAVRGEQIVYATAGSYGGKAGKLRVVSK